MYNENLVVTVLDEKRNLRIQGLYRQNSFVLPETLQLTWADKPKQMPQS